MKFLKIKKLRYHLIRLRSCMTTCTLKNKTLDYTNYYYLFNMDYIINYRITQMRYNLIKIISLTNDGNWQTLISPRIIVLKSDPTSQPEAKIEPG